jgi:branched-subunit amino acid ABC-type transport system permease component
MQKMLALWRRVWIAAMAVWVCAGGTVVALAGEPEKKTSSTTAWTMAYAVVFLVLVLALMLLLRPSGRRERAKLDD